MEFLDLLNALWEGIKEYYRGVMGTSITDIWFNGLEIQKFEDNVITMATPSEIKISYIKEKFLPEKSKNFIL